MEGLGYSDFGQLVNGRNPDAALHVKFYLRAVENKNMTEKEGRPIFTQKEFVEIHMPGSPDIIDRQVKPSDLKRFPMQYAAFKEQNEQASVGTPVEQWPPLSVERVAVLKALHIHTVEQLAEISDIALQKVGMGGIELRAKAQAFIEAANGSAKLHGLASENERLKQQVALLQEQMADINAKFEKAMTGAKNVNSKSSTGGS